jgi:hypothetical protein
MPTPAIQTLLTDAQQVLNLNSLSEVRATMAAALANANVGTPLNPNLTTQQLWDEFYLIVRQPESDIESIITNQLMKFLYAPPAPGGVGADGQVIFNDGGVLAGDPQFLWNKTTNLLTVTGSATITGALTVDTTTLVVNPSGYADRVGIGTATPATLCEMRTTGATNALSVYMNGGGSANIIAAKSFLSPFGEVDRFTVAGNGVCTWSNVGDVYGTAMTLNSTGLGVGVSPSYKIHSVVTSGFAGKFNSSTAVAGGILAGNSIADLIVGVDASGNGRLTADTSKYLGLGSGGINDRVILDSSGNVGIGVTPSAWFSTWKVLQLAGGSFGGPSDRSFSLQNAIVNASGQFQYVSGSSTPASGYRQFNGAHDWYTAAAGTSPNQITDFSSAKMTLDASGNLILLSSNTPATLTTNGQLTVNATSNTNLRFSYRGSDGVTRTANLTLA